MKPVARVQEISAAASGFAFSEAVPIAGIGAVISEGDRHVTPCYMLRCMSKAGRWHDKGNENDEGSDKIHRRECTT